MTDILCFGELLWDVFGKERKVGGAPFNVAAIARLLGMDSAMITAVGDDPLGEELIDAAKDKTDLIVQVNDKPTGTVQVTLDKDKDPAFDIKDDVAYDHIEFDDRVKDACRGPRFFCFGSLAQRDGKSRETLKRILDCVNAVKIYDCNYREGIPGWDDIFRDSVDAANILKMSAAELLMLMRMQGKEKVDQDSVFDLMRGFNIGHVFVTRGGEGASLYTGGEVFHAPAPEVDVLDTTGCGDAFTAAIALALKDGLNNQKMLEYAVKVSAKVAAVKGAVPERI